MSDYSDYTKTYTYYTSNALGTLAGALGTIGGGAYNSGLAGIVEPDNEWEARREALLNYQSQVNYKISYGVSKPNPVAFKPEEPAKPPLITVDPEDRWFEPRAE